MSDLPDILAVDGGNSKVDAVLLSADGEVLGAGRGGPAPFAPGEEDKSIAALLEAAGRAAGEAGRAPGARPLARLAVLCLAGCDLPVDDRRLLRALRRLHLADELILRNDTFAVLRAGTERDWGVGVVCGAGMNCSAVAPSGRLVRFAALGEISGDDGGGGWLGRQAVRAAVRGHDGRDPHTVLERQVPAYFGRRSVVGVLEALQTDGIGERQVAGLAPLVFAAAAGGDAVSQALVDLQADEIVAMVVSAVRRLHLTRRDVDVVLGGGLFDDRHGGFVERIAAGVHAVAPAARVQPLTVPPVVGACLLGCDHVGTAHGAGGRIRSTLTRERLMRSQEA
jgi:N-acetylglucosamine kinase-like BadF-type ATPase